MGGVANSDCDTIHVVPDEGAAALAAARLAAAALTERAAQTDGPVHFVLSGGRSPRAMYERLAGLEGPGVPWPRIHILWGDERCVPPDDPRSNYRMALETGLLGSPLAGIHRMAGELAPEEAASCYVEELRALFPADYFPRLDLVLLGMGEDGHVASLVPGSAALQERERWVAPTEPYQGTRRLTLTLPVLAASRRLLFLVAGESKAQAVRAVLAAEEGGSHSPPGSFPVPARVLLDMVAASDARSEDAARQQAGGPRSERRAEVTWIIDDAAASLLPSSEGGVLTDGLGPR
jgi:6-phosphogluconolactonase